MVTAQLAHPAIDRDAWLAARREGLGGTDVSAIIGQNPYRTPLDVYLDKRGLVPELHETPRMRMGRRREQSVADEYEFLTGKSLVEPGLIVHASQPWRRGTPDREVLNERGVEIKTGGHATRMRYDTGDIPREHLIQAHWYMDLMDRHDVWDIAADLEGNDGRLVIVEIARDRELEALLVEEGERFWVEHVEAQVPPPPDPDRDGKALAFLFSKPRDDVDQDESAEARELAERLAHVKDQLAALEKDRKRLENMFRERIGERRGIEGTFEDGRAWRALWSPYEKQAYEVPASSGRTFRFYAKKGTK